MRRKKVEGIKLKLKDLARQFRLKRSLFLFFLLFIVSTTIPLAIARVSLSQNSANSLQLLQQGQTLYQTRDFEAAVIMWQKTIERFAIEGDRLNQAMALSNLSLTYQQLGQWDNAKNTIAQSFTLLKNIEPTPHQQRILASSLEIEGQLQLSLGQPENALTTWQKATDTYEQNNDRLSTKRVQINQAQAMQNLGLYPRACQTLLEALDIDSQECEVSQTQLQNANTSQSLSLQILGLRSLGNVLRLTGQTEQSQQVLLRSWQLAEKLENYADLETIYLSLGNTARTLANQQLSRGQKQILSTSTSPTKCLAEGIDKTATQFYRQASDCYRLAELTTKPLTQIQARLNLFSLALQTQELETIEELLPQILSQLDRLPPSHTSINTRLKLAQNLICLQSTTERKKSTLSSPLLQSCPQNVIDTNELSLTVPSWQEIRQLLTVTLELAKTLGDRRVEANIYGYLAAIDRQIGNLTSAEQLTEKALQGLSSFNNPELVYLWQWQLGRLYRLQNRPQEAIAAYTSAWEILQSLRQDLVATNPDVQYNFRDRVEPVYRELVALLLQPDDDGKQIAQDNLKQARDVIESLQLAELNNFFQEACIDAQPQQIDRIDRQAGVIYSIILPERLAVILSVRDRPLQYYETVLDSSSQKQGTEIIEAVFEDMFANLNPYISSANPLSGNQQFYDWLIRPLETELENNDVKTLVFVLDGILRSLPMSALHDGERYLVEKYNIALTPGLQLLSSRSLADEKLKVLAAGLAQARQGFSALPGVEEEVSEIARVASTEVLLNREFTSSRVREEIESVSYPIVHLATHGQFSSRAENTFLLTWDERINVKNLDRLLRERAGKELSPIELLILSACQTAAGDKRASLGLAGVAVRSGARSTLATLWSVQDKSTADLIARFYQNFSQPGVSKAEALREAQLSLLRSTQYQHPFYWAPFVLVGNWQ